MTAQGMTGRLLRPENITEAMISEMPDTLFIFGDNMARAGFGGQAKVMRGKPNSVGVPTKWLPARGEAAYFSNLDLNDPRVRYAIDAAFSRALGHILSGEDVVVPKAGLGTGLSQLPSRAPVIHGYIGGWIAALKAVSER